MTRKFFDREKELKILNEIWDSDRFEFMIIYGRRRVGKTDLIKKFCKNKKSIYYLCSKRKMQYNLKKFSEKVCDFIGIPPVVFGSFQEAFDALLKNNRKIVIAIDEFSYLIKRDSGILSDFQEIVDEKLKDKNVKLILCGSSIGMMESRVLGSGSPLYGRSTRQLRLRPFTIEDTMKWFPHINIEETVRIYSVTGGVAKYLEFFSGKNVAEEIKNRFFDPSSFLFSDALYLLSEELRDYSTYMQILEAISLGHTKINEIGNYSFVQPKDVFFYLKNLSSLGIVKRIVPVLSPRKAKRGIYTIDDNYFNFWFRFVSPFQAEIESFDEEIAMKNFKRNFNTYLGGIFEKLCFGFLKSLNLINYTKIGRWWHKDREIDIVALNEQKKEILFAECKWKEEVNAERVFKELKEKAGYVQWNDGRRKEHYAIFARSFRNKDVDGIKLFDLKDLENLEIKM